MNRRWPCRLFPRMRRRKRSSARASCCTRKENSGARAPASCGPWNSPAAPATRGWPCRPKNMLGHVEYGAGDVHAARDRFVCSVAGFKALALPWGAGNALSGLAGATLASGDAEQAECLLEEAETVLRHAGPWFSSLALYVRGILEVRRGNPDKAIALARENLTHIRGSTTSLPSSTRWSLSPPRPRSRETTHGRRRFWALGTPSPNAQAPWWSTNRCTTSTNNRNGRCGRASVRIGGPGPTRQGGVPRSIRC